MEARSQWTRWSASSLLVSLVLTSLASAGAGYRTRNFTVDAPTPALAKEIGDLAETFRKQLAMEWLGKELPNWAQPCPIKAQVAVELGAGGATTFIFDRGEVFGWRMNIQGSRERILDSVLPHEITHTIFACHFRQPLPRWADEGACTTVEHRSEIAKQETMLIEFLQTRRGISFSQMFAMKDYPKDVLPLYAEGHSLAHFLIAQQGKQAFLEFIADGMTDENWPRAIEKRFGYHDMFALQNSWLDWVKDGRPQIQLASNRSRDTPVKQVSTATVVRGQDPGPSSDLDDSTSGEWGSIASTSPTRSRDHGQQSQPPVGPSVYEALSSGQLRR